MDDRELERILEDLSRERIAAPHALILATKSAIHARRMLPLAVFFSLVILALGALATVFALLSLEIPWKAKVCGLMAMLTLSGALNLVVIAARRKIVPFFKRIESTAGYKL